MQSTAIIATIPAKGLISVRAISASERPLWRTEATRTVKSCTHPASTAPVDNPKKARGKAELRRERWAYERACAGDGRKVMAEENPLREKERNCCRPYGDARGSGPAVVEHQGAGGDEGTVISICERVDTENAHEGSPVYSFFPLLRFHQATSRLRSTTFELTRARVQLP